MDYTQVRVWAAERREKLFVVLSVVLLVGLAGTAVVVSAQSSGGVLFEDGFEGDLSAWDFSKYGDGSFGGGGTTATITNATSSDGAQSVLIETADSNDEGARLLTNSSYTLSSGGTFTLVVDVNTSSEDRAIMLRDSECNNIVLGASDNSLNSCDVFQGSYSLGGSLVNGSDADGVPNGQWNTIRIVGNGTHVSVYNNGVLNATTGLTGSFQSGVMVELEHLNSQATGSSKTYFDDVRLYDGAYAPGEEPSGGGGGGVEQNESLQVDTRYYMQPNSTYPLDVYYFPDNYTRNEVTNSSTITIENVTFDGRDVITYNQSAGTVSTINNSTVAEKVNITAEYTNANGTTVNDTQNVVVAAPTVDNLAILPNGLIRTQAVLTDGTLQALLVAALLSVPAARFTNAFAGLAVAEVVVVIGWLAGYTSLGIAMLSVFMAMFVGLNLAANIDYAISRGT